MERTQFMGKFLFFNAILPWELTIGPYVLEREMEICESPVLVPTGTTTSSQAGMEVRSDCKTKRLFSNQKKNPIFPDFMRKQDDKVIWIREK
jgi:hypothetical protein